jgi:CMP-N-acetylneuraminic acid synthetase
MSDVKPRILAVVPARGGSKGVPLKNLQPVLGLPLVTHAAACIRGVPDITRAVVSTDHEEIARVCELVGLAAPFRRPEELAGDRIGDWEVLNHALLEMERIDSCRYDLIVMLQPTAPLRTSGQVTAAIEHLQMGGFDSVWTVTETDLKYHPLKQLTCKEGRLDLFDQRGRAIIARQQLEPIYHRNGVAYVMTRDCILEQRTILGASAGALVLDGPSVSIDTLDDFVKVEAILRARQLPSEGGCIGET